MLPFLLARLRAKNHASEEREAIKKKDIASALLNILLKCQFISMEERHVGVHRQLWVATPHARSGPAPVAEAPQARVCT